MTNEISEWKHLPRYDVKRADHGGHLIAWASLRLKSMNVKTHVAILQFDIKAYVG